MSILTYIVLCPLVAALALAFVPRTFTVVMRAVAILATFISAQWCAAIPNVRILEIDVDDVPWREQLTTAVPEIADGKLAIPTAPGWGADVDEDVLRAHPWP